MSTTKTAKGKNHENNRDTKRSTRRGKRAAGQGRRSQTGHGQSNANSGETAS